MTDRPFTLDRLVRSVGTLLVLAALLWLLWYLRAVLVPFFIALLLAYLLEPLVRLVRRRVKNHTVAVLITLTGIFLLTVSLLLVIIPQITAETRHFARLMTEQMPAWQAEAEHLPWVRRMLEQLSSVDVQSYLTSESLARLAQKVLPGFWQGINNVFGWLLGLAGAITTLIYLVFMLIDQEDVSAHWRNMVPEKYRDLVAGLATDLGEAMEVHFRGQMKIALILSVIYTIGFWLVGLPLSVVLGLLAGMLSLIPYFALLSVPPVLLCALLAALSNGGSFWPPVIGALAVYAVAQTIEGLVLVPRIQGKSAGLRPEYVLLALSVWGALLGVVGMIIALPLTSVLISWYRRFILGQAEERPTGPAPAETGRPSPGGTGAA